MNTKKYQLQTTVITGAESSAEPIFASREYGKTTCWLWAQPNAAGKGGEIDRATLERLLSELVKKPVVSKTKLREYLIQIREKLAIEQKNPQFDPGLMMLVSNYSKIAWAVTGEPRLYLIRNGQIRLENRYSPLLKRLHIKPAVMAITVNQRRLYDGDRLLLGNADLEEQFSLDELKSISAGKSHQDQEYSLALISTRLTFKRSWMTEFENIKKKEVITPMLLVACSGMMAVYQIETQWPRHQMAIHKTHNTAKQITVVRQPQKLIQPSPDSVFVEPALVGPTLPPRQEVVQEAVAVNEVKTNVEPVTFMKTDIIEVLQKTVPEKNSKIDSAVAEKRRKKRIVSELAVSKDSAHLQSPIIPTPKTELQTQSQLPKVLAEKPQEAMNVVIQAEPIQTVPTPDEITETHTAENTKPNTHIESTVTGENMADSNVGGENAEENSQATVSALPLQEIKPVPTEVIENGE